MNMTRKTAYAALLLLTILFLSPGIVFAQSYWDNFRPPMKEKYYAPLIRTGLGVAFLDDKDMDDHYGPGQGLLVDYNYKRLHRSRFGLDLYGRFSFRHFEVKEDNIDPMDVGIQQHHLFMPGLDAGARAKVNFSFLGTDWSYYISMAPRFLFSATRYRQDDGSYGKNKNLFSLGAVAGTGFEMALAKKWGLFLEVDYGYTPVGDSKANVEGMQCYLGATYITWAR
ncbi:MAG: hypothetical protein CVV44_00745 [Spirochaetae bacterium HGW-Spirochaetae-1]|jgi:hypothetical protein|nr:MAG: hypothetical protein CVV44_00745 [Spirochaetae bacterium HGW-Spirochaetae-1]